METVLFNAAKATKAVAVVMRSPGEWQYFGINDIVALVEPYPFMLVGGALAPTGEQCLVAEGASVHAEACLDAVAAGEPQLRAPEDVQPCAAVCSPSLSGW